MITDSINRLIAEAMKARDEVRLSTLKMLLSALNYAKIEKQHDLSPEEENEVVSKEAKKRKDAIEAFDKAGAKDRVEAEKAELAILQEFLPKEITEQELKRIVDDTSGEVGAEGAGDFGKLMGAVMVKVRGRADGGKVSEIVRKKLADL